MPKIGAPLRKWPFFLLRFCWHLAADDTNSLPPQSTIVSHTTIASSHSASLASYIDIETACPSRTINFITQTLPQQCAKTSWIAPVENRSPIDNVPVGIVLPGSHMAKSVEDSVAQTREDDGAKTSVPAAPADQIHATDTIDDGGTAKVETDAELETDSPFDSANFLSFAEWKKKNLADSGQSNENDAQGRAASANSPSRRRPVNVNELDSLGDEGEIELDFTGFGVPTHDKHVASQVHPRSREATASKTDDEGSSTAPSSWTRSKDAGKTCKERFNYASFDCAANVLKANKHAKSSTSILVENKDSYMLNKCSIENKFLIVELCDDILVDTVVLANYEFFSSIFRHFRVSVSLRYPVKMEKWQTLGTFEARNTRDIQAFLIEGPQVWARYLRVEFLTQYGNEFYCPLSLLRVHGTTMMEQFRREEEEARGVVDDDEELNIATQADLIKPAKDSGPLPPEQITAQPVKDEVTHSEVAVPRNSDPQASSSSPSHEDAVHLEAHTKSAVYMNAQSITISPPNQPSTVSKIDSNSVSSLPPATSDQSSSPTSATSRSAAEYDDSQVSTPCPSSGKTEPSAQNTAPESANTPFITSTRENTLPSSAINSTAAVSSTTSAKIAVNSTIGSSQTQQQTRGVPTQPNSATPSTQESFYKSIHKRLLQLEANSTLSLQYIEEQSRILRDAFMKVEKRQLAKTEKFLEYLNSTVMQELESYRNMYEQLWQSTVVELDTMKQRQKSELGEIGARLGLMADELVWQKRMAVVQSTLLLLCLGLVLFVRSGTLSATADVPIVHKLGRTYSSFFETSPPHSPEQSMHSQQRHLQRNKWRSDVSIGLSDLQSDEQPALTDAETDGRRSPDVDFDIPYSPPHSPEQLLDLDPPPAHIGIPALDALTDRVQVLETQSGPATPNGTRDSLPSWEEVDRAIDELNKEVGAGGKKSREARNEKRRKKRSERRKARGSFDGEA